MNKAIIGMTIATIATGSLLGCNKTEEGASMGAIIGALAGQAIGGDTGGTLIGAGVGAMVGGAIGNDQQKQENQNYQRLQNSDGSTVRRTTTHETLDENGNVVKTGTTTTTSTQTTGGYSGLED
jgi:uncharacterized protein YcfJ